MKLFLRGVLALGLSAALTATALCDTPAPRATVLPASPTPPATAPAVAAPGAPAGGCSTYGGRGLAGHVHHGRFGIGDRLGGRVDAAVERYEGFNGRLAACLAKLAGPPAEVGPGGLGAKQKGGPNTQPGTVVFPQHPFARSPRDYFMQD